MVVAEEREERETLLMSEFERMRVSGKNIYGTLRRFSAHAAKIVI